MLPASPDLLRFADTDLVVKSLTSLNGVAALSGVVRRVLSATTAGATLALTAAQTGALVMFDRAAGCVVTLPTPVVGLEFEFVTPTTVTSNSHKVITDAGTTFLKGVIGYGILDTTPGANPGPKFTAADGSTHVAITMGGSITGGLFGTAFRLKCVSATLWHIEGQVIASGTIQTPFATS